MITLDITGKHIDQTTPEQLDNAIQNVITEYESRPDRIIMSKQQLARLICNIDSWLLDDHVTRNTIKIGLWQEQPTWRGLALEILPDDFDGCD